MAYLYLKFVGRKSSFVRHRHKHIMFAQFHYRRNSPLCIGPVQKYDAYFLNCIFVQRYFKEKTAFQTNFMKFQKKSFNCESPNSSLEEMTCYCLSINAHFNYQ